MAPEGPIVDVAQRAGVSAATVSRALRNQQYVAEATRDRVLAAAQALHYVADTNASRLASGRSHTVGLAPILTSWYTSEIIVGVEEVLAEVGLDLLISTQGLPHKGNQFALASAFHQRVDGVILVDAFVHESGARELVKSSTPAVALGERLEAVPSVCIDNHLGGELGTRHLLELGHRRIALMRDTSSHDRSSTVVPRTHQRLRGRADLLSPQDRRVTVGRWRLHHRGWTARGSSAPRQLASSHGDILHVRRDGVRRAPGVPRDGRVGPGRDIRDRVRRPSRLRSGWPVHRPPVRAADGKPGCAPDIGVHHRPRPIICPGRDITRRESP